MSDFSRLTKPQINALCQVAFGGSSVMHKRTAAILVERGLIEPIKHQSADRLGTFTWTEYVMPIPVHIDFCAWCEANAEVVDS